MTNAQEFAAALRRFADSVESMEADGFHIHGVYPLEEGEPVLGKDGVYWKTWNRTGKVHLFLEFYVKDPKSLGKCICEGEVS